MSATSPALTASSSSTAYHSQSEQYDPLTGLPVGKIEDFSDLFDFNQFDSSDSSASHSPNTISPNHTPSPLTGGASPYAVSGDATFDFLNQDYGDDFPTDYPMTEKPLPSAAREAEVIVKQEPVEFSFPIDTFNGQQVSPQSASQQQSEAVPDMSDVYAQQQEALQQLINNLFNYQQQQQQEQQQQQDAAAQQQQYNNQSGFTMGTIQPSMVFNTPGSMQSSMSGFESNNSAPVSGSVSPVAQFKQPLRPIHETSEHDDELIAIDPHEQPIKVERSGSSSMGRPTPDDLDAKIESLVPLPDIFSAGRGKGGKKGGGMSSVVRMDDEELDDDDDWRPSPEEYKKLSSKEKRQLRNKLSARAFRTRRKDYIGTLEAHIQDRDTVIDAMRSELVSSRSETQDLRRELEILKRSTMSILHPESATSLSSPAPSVFSSFAMGPSLPAMMPTAPVAGPSTQPAHVQPLRTATPKFNVRKDLPASPAILEASRGFWGGSNDALGGSGSTICHHTFTPDLVLPNSPTSVFKDLPRANINPRLNDNDHAAPLPNFLQKGKPDDLQNTFSEWSESNTFNLRSMDTYRMQIWSRLAREAAAEKTSVPHELRPKFYVGGSSSDVPSAGVLAAVTSNHITTKLVNSFWSAFSRTPVSSGSSSLDTDKLAAVVTGNARLKVVPTFGGIDADELVASMGSLRLQSGLTGGEGQGLRARENPLGAITNLFFGSTAPVASR